MDPTAADVRAGTATYNTDTGTYQWLPGYDPTPSAGEFGISDTTVTITAPPKADHSALWLVLALGVTWWVLEG